jgi:hypothetical protein
MEYAVCVKGLSKRFYRYHADRPWTLHEAFVKGLRRLQPAHRFWALRDVSFSVAPGRVVGIIGPNSDGKQFVMPMTGDMNALPMMGGSEKLSIAPGESREIVMSEVFQGGEGLTYSYVTPDNMRVSFDESSGTLKVTAPNDWTGKEDITLKATDGTATVYKTMSVSVAPQSSFAMIAGFTAAIVIAVIVIAAIWKTQKE